MRNIPKFIAWLFLWPVLLPWYLWRGRQPKPPAKPKRARIIPPTTLSEEYCLSELKSLGISKAAYARARQDLTKQFGHAPLPADVAWRLYIEASMAASQRGEWGKASIIYYTMAQQVQRENKDSLHLLQQAARFELFNLRASGVVTQVRIDTANDNEVCPACRKHKGKIMTIEAALNSLPVPNQCQNPHGCRCSYSPVIK